MAKIYLDHSATTPLHPEVKQAMEPYLTEAFGNPQSLHSFGNTAKQAIEEARSKVAQLIGAQPEEIYFTASGAESNNFALKGIAWAYREKGNHIITSAIEHYSVLYSAKTLSKWGYEITTVPVDKYGIVDPDTVRKALKKTTILISIMHANNEIGTIEPIKEIAQIAQEHKVPFHSDGVATVGQIPVNVDDLGISALSLAGHTFYGPKGAAALYLRKGTRIMPLIEGGVQEGGRRGGTENVAGIVGLGKACELAQREMVKRIEHTQRLRDRIIQELPKKIERVYLTGHPQKRLPNHASFCIEFIEGEAMLLFLDDEGIAAASGSACTSRALKASHVLLALGIDHALAQGSIVFTLGKDNSDSDIDALLTKLPPIVERLRQMSPLYAKFQKGEKLEGGKECIPKK
ncbi:MAG: IscS subfamily cysteine desulfurase [candidate division WOR-3 bacterium]